MVDTISNVHKKKEQNIVVCSWNNLDSLVLRLSELIPKNKYKNIYGLPRAGSIIGAMVAYKLNLPMVESSSVSKDTLVVDEICDSGKTLFEFTNKYGCDTAVLHKRYSSSFNPKYVVEILKHDDWLKYPYE